MRSLLGTIIVLMLLLAGAAWADEPAGQGTASGNATAATVPAGHPVAMPEGLTVELRKLEPLDCAYLEGTLFGDMDALFWQLAEQATEQGLLTDDTRWGSAYPDDMSQGVDETTRVFAGITIDPDAEVAEPLKRGTVAGGTYLVVQHRGDYATLGDTYTAVYTWAAKNGVTFGTPTLEYYVTDPESTPVEDWLTEIYFPFDHGALQAAYAGGDAAQTGADGQAED